MNNTKITPVEKYNALQIHNMLVGKKFTTQQITNILSEMGNLLMAKAVSEEAAMNDRSPAARMQ